MTQPRYLDGPYSRRHHSDHIDWLIVIGIATVTWLFIAGLAATAYLIVDLVF